MGDRSKFMMFLLLSCILLCQLVGYTGFLDSHSDRTPHQIVRSELSWTPKATKNVPMQVFVNMEHGFFYHKSERCPSMFAYECSQDNAVIASVLPDLSRISAYEASYRGFSPCPDCVIGQLFSIASSISSLDSDISTLDTRVWDLSTTVSSIEDDVLDIYWKLD